MYLETSPWLFRVAYRIVGRSGVAEDVLQESFISIWENAKSYRSDLSSPMTWLMAIVRNRAIDATRGIERLFVPLPDDGDRAGPTDSGPEQVVLTKQVAALFDRHLAGLHAGQRQAIYMAYYGGLTRSEIARAMGIPCGTVKTWIRRGMEKWKA